MGLRTSVISALLLYSKLQIGQSDHRYMLNNERGDNSFFPFDYSSALVGRTRELRELNAFIGSGHLCWELEANSEIVLQNIAYGCL